MKSKRLSKAEQERREAVRQEVFTRDGWRCLLSSVSRCFGKPQTFHHRRKAGRGGKYTVANGATLCAHHNDQLEADADLAALARHLGLVVREGDDEWDALGREEE